jgi:hypothetical protein
MTVAPNQRTGTPIDRAKLLSVGYLAGGRTRDRVAEGRSHPETGRPYKTTSNEAGAVTEHATNDDRVDAVARVATVRATATNNGRLVHP